MEILEQEWVLEQSLHWLDEERTQIPRICATGRRLLALLGYAHR